MIAEAATKEDKSLSLEGVAQLERLINSLDLDPVSPLNAKAKRIVQGMIDIWRRNGGHFRRADIEAIQDLVLYELSPADFKDIAVLSFAKWATPARLSGPGLPHINRVNQCLAQQVATLAKVMKNQIRFTMLDLGSGLLSTTESVAEALTPLGIALDITAVDSTPVLVEAAHHKATALTRDYPYLHLDIYQGDMLDYSRSVPDDAYDFVIASFVIHHLHPEDQVSLVVEARRVLREGGALLVADPQEGKSDFNLNVLIYEEPEAVFAAFTSPEDMCHMMSQAGFTSIEVLMRDDIGYEAYAVSGRVPSSL